MRSCSDKPRSLRGETSKFLILLGQRAAGQPFGIDQMFTKVRRE